MRVLLRPVLVPELGLVIVKPGREPMPVFHNTRLLVEPEPKSMRNLPSGVVPAARQPLVHCLTGCCAILNPASGHTAIIITAKPSFTVMVPAQWCCAGTATTSCVTRHPNHSSN